WSRPARFAIAAAYTVTLGGQLVGAFVSPDARDLLAGARETSVAHAVDRVQEISGVALGLVVLALVLQRVLSLRGPGRRAQGPLLVAAAVTAPTLLVWLGTVIANDGSASTLDTIERAVAATIPLGVIAGIVWSRLRRPGASELVVELRAET